jgi:hypothetical protein
MRFERWDLSLVMERPSGGQQGGKKGKKGADKGIDGVITFKKAARVQAEEAGQLGLFDND